MIKPIVGISTCFEKQGQFTYHQTGDKYITAVVNAINGFPILIPSLADKLDLTQLLSTVDGIML
ncbi:MAG TPA: gamma-glutamyl-gamma-aminobutyrate hydrolase family protein, partial [Candidatus Marinimicrobia bacterium]|nr:gamma-glutamyl-gamma-aminobutyrate hydrolase family protein [Candidatus Neomarinimicrobiota bacterium]